MAVLKILHLEDVEEDALVVRALLQQELEGCEPMRVDDLGAFERELQDPSYGLVLMDYTLPGIDALSVLSRIRQARPDLPVILVTGTLGEERAVECLKNGATDFILKSNLKRLPLAVLRALKEAEARFARAVADRQLSETLQRLSDMKHALDVSALVQIVDPERRALTYVNETYTELMEYTVGELIGTSPDLRSRDLHAPEFLEGIWGTLSAGKVWKGEILHRKKTGDVICLDMTIVPFKDGQGRITHHLCVGFDVTSRRLAEQALEKSEERFRLLFQTAAEGILAADIESRQLMFGNPALCRMLGYTEAELRGLSVEDIHPKEDLPRVIAEFEAQARKERVVVRDVPCLRKDGTRLFADISTAAVMMDGRMLNVGLFTDITKRKEDAEEILRLNETLERRVEARTLELEAANKDLESFSYSVSHDLRAPLRHMEGFLEMLTEHLGTGLDPKAAHCFEIIKASCLRMNQLIDDLLRFSRFGRQELLLQPLDLDRLVGEVIRDLKPDAGERRLSWRIGPLPRVQGDPILMRAVFENLLGNAVKFTRTRPEALIEVGALEPPAGEWWIFIRDNGVGFDMRYAGKLFAVFQRLHPQDEFEGNGIGLANVQRILQRHKGRIWAEGSPGEGATFTFSLPRE